MKRSSKIIISSLIVVAISGSVFAFGAHHHWINASPDEKADMINDRISRELDLTSQQQANLAQLTQRAAQLMEEMRVARGQRSQLLDDVLSEGPMDQAELLQQITDKTGRINQLAPEMVGLLAQFVDSLDAEQKAELREMASKRRGSRGWGKHHGSRDQVQQHPLAGFDHPDGNS